MNTQVQTIEAQIADLQKQVVSIKKTNRKVSTVKQGQSLHIRKVEDIASQFNLNVSTEFYRGNTRSDRGYYFTFISNSGEIVHTRFMKYLQPQQIWTQKNSKGEMCYSFNITSNLGSITKELEFLTK